MYIRVFVFIMYYFPGFFLLLLAFLLREAMKRHIRSFFNLLLPLFLPLPQKTQTLSGILFGSFFL